MRRPGTILHLFCNIDLLPGEITRWKGGGYRVVRGVPFDMFPGTPEVELMVLLKPG
jgi:tRNA/tmRNA/rRNA uracil-C5-methylase (TrmA/RlmC/RlmD family)